MRIAFRTDASLHIGTGHVMRCLTLADALREYGAQSTFICRPHVGHLLDLIQQRGHSAVALAPANEALATSAEPSRATWLGTDWVNDVEQTKRALGGQELDWLVVDHYALDSRWEKAIRPYTRHILSIDDLADRPHECDILLDQNLGRQASDYCGLLNSNAQILVGPEYALLRQEFAKWREYSLIRRAHPELKHLLITMGGVDQKNVTGQVLEALTSFELPTDLRITVVVGPSAPWLGQLQAQAAAMPQKTVVLVSVNNMAQLMAESDLCIGAAGSTCWERCCLGLPSIQIVLAANQVEAAYALTKAGAALSVNLLAPFTTELELLVNSIDTKAMRTLTENSTAICNGNGTTAVVAQLIASVT